MEEMEKMELELVEDYDNYEVDEDDYYVEEENNKFGLGLFVGLASGAGLLWAGGKIKKHIDKKKHEKEVLKAALLAQQPVVENPVQIVNQEPTSVEEAE